MAAGHRNYWQSAAAIAAAVFVAAGAFALSGESHAQSAPRDQRAQKKAPPAKAPTQMRKGPMGNAAIGPNRMGPRGPMLGPQGMHGGPNAQPNMRGPGFANRDPRLNGFNRGPTRRFGNPALGTQSRFGPPRGFTNRDPRLRAVNG